MNKKTKKNKRDTKRNTKGQAPKLLKLEPCTWLKKEGFQMLRGPEPQLVLWAEADPNDAVTWPGKKSSPAWKSPKDWVRLYHQTAGYACMHKCIWAKFLKPKGKIRRLMNELSQDYLESCIWPPARLETARGYERKLRACGLTADSSHHHLQEGFYPIDAECAPKVTREKLPKDLAKLVKPDKNRWARFFAPRFGLAILAENCD